MKGGRHQFGWLALLYIIFAYSQALASSAWILRRPLPTGNGIGGVASGDGRYVAVGNLGTIVVSTDGTNWASAPSHVDTALYAVTHVEKGFVAVGANGTVLRSIHGNGWEKCHTTTQAPLFAVTYGGGRHVAVGEKIVNSKDGIHWTAATNYYGFPLLGVAYGNGLFVAVTDGKTVTSEDGLIWTTHLQSDRNLRFLRDVIYAGGRFLAAADYSVATSIDGTNWATTGYLTTGLLGRIAYGNGNYVGLDAEYQRIYTSPDGDTWTGYDLPGLKSFWTVTFGNNQFVAAGLGGGIMTSSNGMEWARQGKGDSPHLHGVAHGQGKYVAVGEAGTILCSARGDSWSPVTANTGNDLYCVVHGGKRFIAGGYGTVLTSTDGTNWATQEMPGVLILGIAYGEGKYVALGTDYQDGYVFASTDGVTWNLVDFAWSSFYTGIAYGNGRFVAFACSNYGPYPRVQVSKDGVDWISPDPNFEGYSGVGFIAFGNGRFVAPGSYGDIYTSENGSKWTRRRVRELQYETPFSISYAGGKFLFTEESGLVISSPDGLVWTEEKTGSDSRLYDMAYGEGSWVAVGENGVILQSHISAMTSFSQTDFHFGRQSVVPSPRHFISQSENSVGSGP